MKTLRYFYAWGQCLYLDWAIRDMHPGSTNFPKAFLERLQWQDVMNKGAT